FRFRRTLEGPVVLLPRELFAAILAIDRPARPHGLLRRRGGIEVLPVDSELAGRQTAVATLDGVFVWGWIRLIVAEQDAQRRRARVSGAKVEHAMVVGVAAEAVGARHR